MKTWLKIMIASAALAAVPGSALAECPSYPDVSWWGEMNHEKAIRYVDKKHGGDWAPYMAKWRRQLTRLEKIPGQGRVRRLQEEGRAPEGQGPRRLRAQGQGSGNGQHLPGR